MSGKTVLLVEDDYDNRAIYAAILRHAGYPVVEAVNGEEGVRLAREHRPELILMDLSMPVLDGWDAIRRLKQDPETEPIPVCALSAHALLEGDHDRAMRAGFACYLTKPIDPKDVLRQVEQRIGPAAGGRAGGAAMQGGALP